MNTNILLMTDSYKASHWVQYPPGSNGYFGYIESRGSEIPGWDKTVFFGLQIFLKEVLSKPFTQKDIDEAAEFFAAHGEPFNKEGWQYVLDTYGGFMPVTIKAVPEGVPIPLGNALVTVECTDPKCFWVGSYLETALLRAVWYPTTVASNSYYCKQVIKKYLDMSSDAPEAAGLMFKLHDFGGRGVSSAYSASIGGAAHLVNFMGSDTVEGVQLMNTLYNNGAMSAFSIPAAEHSTITAWGRENEVEAYRNMLKQFAKPGALVACVSDSYNIFDACSNLWGEVLRQEVVDSGAILVIRPDSGDPASVVLEVLNRLGEKFGYDENKKGFKILRNVRVIQGDGINVNSIEEICRTAVDNDWSIENLAFGMGGALLQQLNRDTFKFAMKCSAIKIGDKWVDVYKQPITDSGKNSKRGRLTLIKNDIGYATVQVDRTEEFPEQLIKVYENGRILKEYTLDEVRVNTQIKEK